MDRAELAARVDELAGRDDFVAAVQDLAAGLTPVEREELGAILLERAGVFERAVHQRLFAKGWLRRQADKLG